MTRTLSSSKHPTLFELLLGTRLALTTTFYGVFFGGMSAIIITRLVFNQYHSDWYKDTIPSISKTGALAHSDIVFAILMGGTGLIIYAMWTYIYFFNKEMIAKTNAPRKFVYWNIFVC